MGGVNQINVVCPLSNQLMKNFQKTFPGNDTPIMMVTDGIILAKDTAQSAAGKEDGTGPIGTGQTGFFPMMEGGTGHDGQGGHGTPAGSFGFGAQGAAPAGT